MTSSEQALDPLFWPLLFVALIFALFVWGFVKVVDLMARRGPGHHPQVNGHQGQNFYDASSHTATNITVDKISVGNAQLRD